MLFASTHPTFRRSVNAPAGRAMERFLSDAMALSRQPSAQLKQDENAFHLTMDVPGVSRDQLLIKIEDSVVRVHSREGSPRQYRAAYELPQEIDAASSEAKLEYGVLTLKLSKKQPATSATEISIQ